MCPMYMQCSTRILAWSLPKNHHGHLSLGLFISSFSGYSLLQFCINSRHFFNFRIVTSGVTTACSPHHHAPSIARPFKPHPHQWVQLTNHFIINPHFSEFIQTMKSAVTPSPCRSTRNEKHAPSSPDQGKAPPPSAQATRTNKKRQTEMAPLTPIAPSPSGNLASLSPPLFFHSWIYCQ